MLVKLPRPLGASNEFAVFLTVYESETAQTQRFSGNLHTAHGGLGRFAVSASGSKGVFGSVGATLGGMQWSQPGQGLRQQQGSGLVDSFFPNTASQLSR